MLPFIDSVSTQKLLAKRLKDMRLDAGWSRAELAERSGVNVNTLIRFERTGEISLGRFLRLLQALGCLQQVESLLLPAESLGIDELLKQQHKRQRGRRRKHD